MNRDEMIQKLNSLDLRRMPHIFIPSYNRPNFISSRLFDNFDDNEIKKVHIVVRKEQYKAYKKANPRLDIIPITCEVNGLASTRQFIFDYAVRNKYGLIMDFDDDIKHLRYMYEGFSCNGRATTKHSILSDEKEDVKFNQKIICLAAEISRDLFKEYPDVVLGNLHRQKACFNVKYGKLKYIINSEVTPRQTTIINVKKLYKEGVNRNMLFDPHGDDIGFAAVILEAGLSCFNIPCLGYEYLSEKCDSVVRTPETAKQLHAYEYDTLQKFEIKNYLRCTFKDENGNPLWNDVDWRKYHKYKGTKLIRQYWNGTKEC
jgi:hypothetical protein